MENWTKRRPRRAWSIAGDDLLDHALEQLGVHRLFQESRCAGGVRLRLDLSVRQRRDDDDRYLTHRRQLLKERHTATGRHHEIEQDELGLLPSHRHESLHDLMMPAGGGMPLLKKLT